MSNTIATCPDNPVAVVGERRHFPGHRCYLRVERDASTGALWLQHWRALANGGFEEGDGCEVIWVDLQYYRPFFADVDNVFHTTFLQQGEAHENQSPPNPGSGLVNAAARAFAYLTNGMECDDDPVEMLQALRIALSKELDDPGLVEHAIVTIPFGMPDWPGQPPGPSTERT